MKKFSNFSNYNIIEFIVSLLLAIISFVLTIIYRNQMVATIISATITIVSIQNIVNLFRENHSKQSINDYILNTKLTIKYVNKFIHISELELIEREFCRKDNQYSNVTVYIISNNLTNDKTQFLDEIMDNIKNGATYVYITTSAYQEPACDLKNYINKHIRKKIDIEKQFKIYVDNEAFNFLPQKYTMVLYDRNLGRICVDNLRGFCCAQDQTNEGIYYFEMSHSNTKEIRKRVIDYCMNNKPID